MKVTCDETAARPTLSSPPGKYPLIKSAERPPVAELLSLMSFFDRQGIPDFVLRGWADKGKDKADTNPELDFEEDLATLRGYCLIAADIEGKTFEMHRLVQFATKRWLEAFGQLDAWRSNFLRSLSAEFSSGYFEEWNICEVLFPHAEAAEIDEPADGESLQAWSRLFDRAAWYASQRCRYDVGERLMRKAISAKERTIECEDPATLNSMTSLAGILLGKGNYDEAEEINQQALYGLEKALGRDHYETLSSMRSLAGVFLYQDKYDAAEKMIRRALNSQKWKDFLFGSPSSSSSSKFCLVETSVGACTWT